MLMPNGDGTYTGGNQDIICILNDVNTGKYHAAFFEESPLPGGNEEVGFLRLKSKMHHTQGAETIEDAFKHVDDMRQKVHVSDDNVWREPKDWDGTQGLVWVVPK